MKKSISILMAVLLVLLVAVGGSATARAASSENDAGGYVLMNIPYGAFYAAEVSDVSGVDTVSSATLMKPRTARLAGGSYHVDPAGSDITGVVFPVYVEDLSALAALGGTEITDESRVEITVTNKGEETTETFTGPDALFEAPSYSWYVLAEEPSVYKTMAADGSFGAVNAEAAALKGAASFVYDSHADVAIQVTDADAVLDEQNVSAVILTADDGTRRWVLQDSAVK